MILLARPKFNFGACLRLAIKKPLRLDRAFLLPVDKVLLTGYELKDYN